MTFAAQASQSYTVIYLALTIVAGALVTVLTFLLKSVIGELKNNTVETDTLARTVASIQATQVALISDVRRHDRILEGAGPARPGWGGRD